MHILYIYIYSDQDINTPKAMTIRTHRQHTRTFSIRTQSQTFVRKTDKHKPTTKYPIYAHTKHTPKRKTQSFNLAKTH